MRKISFVVCRISPESGGSLFGDPVMIDNYAIQLDCTAIDRVSDSVTVSTLNIYPRGSVTDTMLRKIFITRRA